MLTVIPKYDAPLICGDCRLDKGKARIARKAMLDFFGWQEEGREEWDAA
jgi:hypothetical protein